ncbi:Ppx/GppA family phosphatase [Sphingomonas japonica]|uniref:Exopolyphosphatase/guanosine-5'-triphosphate, 3'-diphosphate pyrophosphatase n=1 Tax=Sphingomonas japonica TaxID=511662 RepID=A0ABX0U347_9SPHN|nr:Ppx/GppA family phosphatase [Sphingomonas japonica]NIJ24960.1 exopolyphosphatase/guanosine-5'-triphosphate,3'-diphosphate pyrophosphatase [Sphingomonas japonica]
MSIATLLRRPRADTVGDRPRTAIVDIGSNSIRLVVYQGPARMPAVLFNEKVMAGLGRGLADDGAIAEEGMVAARKALARFAAVVREMQVAGIRTVATAAVREASNGSELMEIAREAGLPIELLSGEEEAIAAGCGVLSAIPTANGIVGDLGGGSLELVRIGDGAVRDRVSFPLGVLRIAAIRARGKGALDRTVQQLLTQAGWAGRGAELPLYLVGGSWRSLARLDMHVTGYPLPVIHEYAMAPEAVSRLVRTLGHVSKATLKAIPNLSGGRVSTLGDGAVLLSCLLRHLGSFTTVVSAFGLREGLLYQRLNDAHRIEDPLIVAAREEGRLLGRFAEHGDLLEDWVAPLFDDDDAMARLRHTACLLADVGWHANPEFRAERGLEVALHGNWVGVDAHGRAVIAQALFTSLGGGIETPDPLGRLADAASLQRAQYWGLAMRLGQRLSGGVAAPLLRSRLSGDDAAVFLHLDAVDRALYGEAVEKRHKALANAVGRSAALAD